MLFRVTLKDIIVMHSSVHIPAGSPQSRISGGIIALMHKRCAGHIEPKQADKYKCGTLLRIGLHTQSTKNIIICTYWPPRDSSNEDASENVRLSTRLATFMRLNRIDLASPIDYLKDQITQWVDKACSSATIIVCEDLNSKLITRGSQAIDSITKEWLSTLAMADLGWQEGSAIIYNRCTFYRRSTPVSVIDYILLKGDNVRVIDASTSTNELWETVTDHHPVVKTIEAIFEQGARITSCPINPWKVPKLNLCADNENIKKVSRQVMRDSW
jgi:hypothetical protein